jgi:hypothetical protein
MEIETERSPLAAAGRFLQGYWQRITTISVLVLIPCFWHRKIEAGDLASHIYNAWLAQLIAKGQAPGLYFAKQWNNVLLDFALLKIGNLLGLAAAEKIVVSLCVLIFFWGAFALVAAVTDRLSWFLLPCLAMLAYGWTFNVGFFNYYLSLGLGFFAAAIVWNLVAQSRIAHPVKSKEENSAPVTLGRRWSRELAAAVLLAALVLVAHPQGFAWLVGCVAYILLWQWLRGRAKLALPIAAAMLVIALRLYCSRHYEMFGVLDSFGRGIYNGSDQIALYSNRYYVLSIAAMLFGLSCFLVDVRRHRRAQESWLPLRPVLELYCIVVFATYVLPDSLRIPLYPGWIGSFALRLTTVSAALGLCVLGFMHPKKWHAAGFGVIAIVFFTFLYQDTAVLNRMEEQIERLVASLPPGERVTATIWAAPDSRLPYIVHIVDRACIGKCFSYENYEPASGEFRIRVEEGSPVASADTDDREDMEAGKYVVQPDDLPMAHIYQCDASDLTWLCIRQLTAGEVNGRVGYRPPKPKK